MHSNNIIVTKERLKVQKKGFPSYEISLFKSGPFPEEHPAAGRNFDIQSPPCPILYSQFSGKSSYLQTNQQYCQMYKRSLEYSFKAFSSTNRRIIPSFNWIKHHWRHKVFKWQPQYAGMGKFHFLTPYRNPPAPLPQQSAGAYVGYT